MRYEWQVGDDNGRSQRVRQMQCRNEEQVAESSINSANDAEDSWPEGGQCVTEQ